LLSLVERVVSPPGQEDHKALIPPAVIRPIMVMVTLPRNSTTTNRQANPVSRPKSRNLNQNPLRIRGFRNISEADIRMVRLLNFPHKNDRSCHCGCQDQAWSPADDNHSYNNGADSPGAWNRRRGRYTPTYGCRRYWWSHNALAGSAVFYALHICDFNEGKKDYGRVKLGNEKMDLDPRLGPVIHA
jgi:hypothetical protein